LSDFKLYIHILFDYILHAYILFDYILFDYILFDYILFDYILYAYSDPLCSKHMLFNAVQQPRPPLRRRGLAECRLQAEVLRNFRHCQFHQLYCHNQRCPVSGTRLLYTTNLEPTNLWHRRVRKRRVASCRASAWIG
jgi:hypothetical protein